MHFRNGLFVLSTRDLLREAVVLKSVFLDVNLLLDLLELFTDRDGANTLVISMLDLTLLSDDLVRLCIQDVDFVAGCDLACFDQINELNRVVVNNGSGS